MSQADAVTNTATAVVVFDIDGVLRDVSGSYRRAIADTVEKFTQGQYRPTSDDIDTLKGEGIWNNDWEASQELTYRYFEQQGQTRDQAALDYSAIVDFFQRCYKGEHLEEPDRWDGYITQEPLLATAAYFQRLTLGGIAWGFFSGATRSSANYVLERRMGLQNPILMAMEDAPGKPDPTGLFAVVRQVGRQFQALSAAAALPVLYIGDTVADMQTIAHARQRRAEMPQGDRPWLAIGVLPPHVLHRGEDYAANYRQRLQNAGALVVLDGVMDLTPEAIQSLLVQRL